MFKYEMHQHTDICSACGAINVKNMVSSIKDSGFTGVVLTNHFYHGNTGIDRSLPWKEFCKAYEEEYLSAKEEGEKIGVDVLYGLEEGVGGGKEVLIYGIEPDFIGNFPELAELNLELLSKTVRDAGGLIIQAHPFRDRNWISNPGLISDEYIDGCEVYNKCNTDEENAKALSAARDGGLIMTSGSDCHCYLSENRFGILSPCRIKTAKELSQVLKSGDYELVFG